MGTDPEPKKRTAAEEVPNVLPLLPVLAFWVHPVGDYATLWFLFGLLYGLLALLERNWSFALLGAFAAIAVISYIILWAFYGFRYAARPSGLQLVPSLAAYSANRSLVARAPHPPASSSSWGRSQ